VMLVASWYHKDAKVLYVGDEAKQSEAKQTDSRDKILVLVVVVCMLRLKIKTTRGTQHDG